jgi:hypothetical protein
VGATGISLWAPDRASRRHASGSTHVYIRHRFAAIQKRMTANAKTNSDIGCQLRRVNLAMGTE